MGERPTVRYMKERDIARVVACTAAAYGDSYPRRDVYDPHWFRTQLGRDNFIFAVAVGEGGGIVGHSALRHAPKGYYELWEGAVHPSALRCGVLEQMTGFLVERATSRGALGLYSFSSASDATRQEVNAKFGLEDAALLLAYAGEITMQGLPGVELEEGPGACLVQMRFFQPLRRRVIYLPEHHVGLAQALYDNLSVSRKVRTSTGKDEPFPGDPTILTLRVSKPYGHASLRLDRLGADFGERLREDHLHLRREGYRAIYLDIPLGDKTAVSVCAQAEALGFFFAGILPSFPTDDLLRLQYLSVPPSFDHLSVQSRFGRDLAAYVARERDRVGSQSS